MIVQPTLGGGGGGYGIFGKINVGLGGNGGYTDSYNSDDGEYCLPADSPLREDSDPACDTVNWGQNGNVGTNGDIEVTSAEGEGTEFRVVLPAASSDADAGAGPAS